MGVTTLIAEPHEIANVFGLAGIQAMAKTMQDGPCDVYIAIPSSVPSTNEQLETTGGIIDNDDVEALMHMDHVICLGEVMNCRDIIRDSHSKTSRLIRQIRAGRARFFPGRALPPVQWLGAGADFNERRQFGPHRPVTGRSERTAHERHVCTAAGKIAETRIHLLY